MNSDRILAEARAVVGMCGCKPYRATFLKWLGDTAPGYRYPLELPYDPSKPPGKRGMSLCSRTTEMIWHHAGVAVPTGMSPPWDGHTFVRTHTWPESVGALGDLRLLPKQGCACWTASHFIACFAKWIEPWDMSLPYQDVITYEGGAQCLLHGNGHEVRGLQAIHEHRRRYWPDTGSGAWIADVDAKGNVGLRSKALGWIDVDRLPTV